MSATKREAEIESNGEVKKLKADPENQENDAKSKEVTTEVTPSSKPEIKDNDKTEPPLICGEVLFCGATNWDLVGRRALPKGMKSIGGPNLWEPHRISTLMNVKIRKVVSSSSAAHCVIITTEGKVYTFGRNEVGQLGLGNSTNRQDTPVLVQALDDKNVVDAACGKKHTLFLTDTGSVFACGENKMGQLGIGNQSDQVLTPSAINYKGPPICRVSGGGEFSAIVDIKGKLYTFGCPEYGQLGHNSDGKYFVTSNKVAFSCENSPRVVTVFVEKARDGQVSPVTDVEVKEIACGNNHMVISDSKKRVFSWGFGGYGRLGHAEPKDELVPRMIKYFDGPNRGGMTVAAGSTYSMAVGEHGGLLFWGTTKSTGEATMYPKLVQDLSGWKVRNVGTSNKSIVVAADNSVISWGPSPAFGELGYGDCGFKTSTTPREVRPVENLFIHSLSCGYSHTLMIARADTEEDKEAIEKLPVFTP